VHDPVFFEAEFPLKYPNTVIKWFINIGAIFFARINTNFAEIPARFQNIIWVRPI
jgi:hypothetical protein